MAMSESCIENDLLCGRCGYNLRTLRWTGRCPECDLPIGDSQIPGGFRLTSWQQVRKIRLAIVAFSVGILGWAVLNILMQIYYLNIGQVGRTHLAFYH